MTRQSPASRRAAAFNALALALALTAASGARAELRVLAPPDGSLVAKTPVTLIGSGATGAIEVTVTGQNSVNVGTGKLSGKAFTAEIKLTPGENTVLVRSREESRRLVYTLTTDEKAPGVYRYHEPVADGECKECHPQGVGRTSPVSEARLCATCHDPQTGYKRLHGPLGAGQCSICHDPHGSAHPAFLVMGVRALCVQCHAQSRSQSHIEKSANKQCPECHNPHGSEKQFLLY